MNIKFLYTNINKIQVINKVRDIIPHENGFDKQDKQVYL